MGPKRRRAGPAGSRCPLALALLALAVALAVPAPGDGAAALAARCHSSQLAVRQISSGGAAGHVGAEVFFQNHGAAPCTLYGYPGLQMLAASGRPLPTEVQRGIAYTVPSVGVRRVTLRPGASAAFDVGWADQTGYGRDKCPTSSRVEVTPPDAFRTITISWHIEPYGGASIEHLRCGEVTVSAVFAPPARGSRTRSD